MAENPNESTGHEPDDQKASQQKPAKASGISRREMVSGMFGALVGVTAGAAGVSVVTDTAPAAAPSPTPSPTTGTAGVADKSRAVLGGKPIIDAPFPNGEAPMQPLRERVLALKDLLEREKVVDPAFVSKFISIYEQTVGPRYGAAAVAHIWSDPAFREAVLNPPADKPFAATTLIAEYLRSQKSHESFVVPETPGSFFGPEGEWLRVVANGKDEKTGKRIHNIVTCTACSCYPQALLGIQPIWYKSSAYRARTITSPRGVMREFAEAKGTDALERLDEYLNGIDEVRVWDSNSEVRFLVVPEIPDAYQGLSAEQLKAQEEKLRELVTRNSMVGVEIL